MKKNSPISDHMMKIWEFVLDNTVENIVNNILMTHDNIGYISWRH